MERKYMILGVVVTAAVLLPLGKWLSASRQQEAARTEDRKVEQRFVADRQAAGQAMSQQKGAGVNRKSGGGGPNGSNQSQRAQDRQKRMEEMAKVVGLSAEQMKQVAAVQASTRPLMGDIFRNPKLTQKQKQAAVADIRKAQTAQISKFLTPEQMTNYTAYQSKMHQERQARRAAREAGGGGASGATGNQGVGGIAQ